MKRAFVTLLSSKDYLPAVLILNKTMKQVNSIYPLLVAVTENVISDVQEYLEKENILYREIPFLEYSKEIQQEYNNQPILNTASKIAIFMFQDYDKIIYLDADTYIYQNIDDLFYYPDGAMLDEYGKYLSGLMVIEPKNHNANYYYTLIRMFPVLDGTLFENLFFMVKSNPAYRIDNTYFVNIMLENLDFINFNRIKAIQYCYKYKPWYYNNESEYFMDLFKEFPKFKTANNSRRRIIKDYFDQIQFYKNLYPEIFI